MTLLSALPPQPIGTEVLLERYAHPGESSAHDVQRRVAHALSEAEAPDQRAAWTERFLAVQREGFIPGGRVLAAAGTGSPSTWINCFVQPLGDGSRDDTEAGWPDLATTIAEATRTMRLGGGVGYDFSRIRPDAAPDVIACLHRLDEACEALAMGSARRGAQMAVLRCDHPQIERFIHAKDSGGLRNFNLAVGITDAFMQAVQSDSAFELVHRSSAAAARTVPARALWRQLLRSAWDHGEPGVLFLDTINRDNNLGWCETIAATNPCAEEPLPPYGCCCLGSIDLTHFVRDPFDDRARFDEQAFASIVPLAVRMLDNVLDLTPWPLPQQQREAHGKRRIGLGFTGLGDALVMLGLRYDSDAARDFAAGVAKALRDAAYAASAALARERGPFPLFDAKHLFAQARFASRLPMRLKQLVAQDGLRHSHLLAIAPTGSISLAFCDNVSNGIEPAFAWRYSRRRRQADGRWLTQTVEDHALRVFRHRHGDEAALPPSFVSAHEIAPEAHVAMLGAVAPFIDGAISKTINVPTDGRFEDFDALYRTAWAMGLKGLASYRANPVIPPLLSVAREELPLRGCRRATR